MMRKKIIKISAIILLVVATLEISAVLANNLFFEKVAIREAQKKSLPKNAANAIKHAYASSLLYSGLRNVFFSENAAKNTTIFLGKVNEIAEVIFKPNQDSTLEMMKDLSNNVFGICAAQFLEKNHNNLQTLDRLDFIGSLAQEKRLLLNREDVNLNEDERKKARESSDYFAARNWLDSNLDKIYCEPAS